MGPEKAAYRGGWLSLGDRLAMGSCGYSWVQFEALFAG